MKPLKTNKRTPRHRATPQYKKSNAKRVLQASLGVSVAITSLGLTSSAMASPNDPVMNDSNFFAQFERAASTAPMSVENVSSAALAVKVKDVKVSIGSNLVLERASITSKPAPPPPPTPEEERSTSIIGQPTKAIDGKHKFSKVTALSHKISKWQNPIPGAGISSNFGHRSAIPAAGVPAGLHNGTDLAAPMGASIQSAFDGEVVHVGFGNFDTHTGGIVVILHKTAGGDYLTSYNHMKTSGILVKVGDIVSSGDTIAKVGSEGKSSGPHLHFSVREVTGEDPLKDWKILDPIKFMSSNGIHLGR